MPPLPYLADKQLASYSPLKTKQKPGIWPHFLFKESRVSGKLLQLETFRYIKLVAYKLRWGLCYKNERVNNQL